MLETMFTTTEVNEGALHCFAISGFSCKTIFAYKQKLIYGEKRKSNVFENCSCLQVNKAKNFGDKQRSP